MQERFKRLLEEKNLTATKFAGLIKVNASAMSHILNGRSKPGFDVLDKIGQAFPDVNLNWLISGKGNMYLSVFPDAEKFRSPELLPKREPQLDFRQSRESFQEPALAEEKSSIAAATASEIATATAAATGKHSNIKRIILFFEDGSFEDYISR